MRNGLIAGVLIAAIFALLCIGHLALVGTLAIQQLEAQASFSIATLTTAASGSLQQADKLTAAALKTTNDQRRLMNASTAAVGRLIEHTDASLNCDVIGKMGHGTSAVDCRQLGVLVRASDMVSNEDKRLESFSVALAKAVEGLTSTADRLNVILGDDSIPRIQKALAEAAEHFDGTTVHLEAMSAEGQKGMTELSTMIFDLRHPQKPGKFLSALNFALKLLGVTYQARGALAK